MENFALGLISAFEACGAIVSECSMGAVKRSMGIPVTNCRIQNKLVTESLIPQMKRDFSLSDVKSHDAGDAFFILIFFITELLAGCDILWLTNQLPTPMQTNLQVSLKVLDIKNIQPTKDPFNWERYELVRPVARRPRVTFG